MRRTAGRAVFCVSISIVGLAGCGDSTPEPVTSYFTIRPVSRESAPPCLPPALSELKGGSPYVAKSWDRPGVDANDITSAAVVVDPVTGNRNVEFALSPEGTERFNALAKAVGLRGQAAVVVDGVVVNAPRFETTDFPGKGLVTGLDAGVAQRLADRLNRS